MQPYNRTWVLLGTAILWIGWYGFNAGSALGANMAAVTAALTTSLAAASAMCTWMVLDVERGGKPTLIGGCTGALCGLVGITPAAGYVTLFGSFVIGIIATLCSYAFINVIKPRLHVDDALDAFGCHGVSGIVGSLLTGFFCHAQCQWVTARQRPVLRRGMAAGGQSADRHRSVDCAGRWLTALICIVLRRFIPMRVAAHDEAVGLDISEHGEVADERSQNEVLQYPDEFIGQLGGFAPKPSRGRRQPPKSSH